MLFRESSSVLPLGWEWAVMPVSAMFARRNDDAFAEGDTPREDVELLLNANLLHLHLLFTSNVHLPPRARAFVYASLLKVFLFPGRRYEKEPVRGFVSSLLPAVAGQQLNSLPLSAGEMPDRFLSLVSDVLDEYSSTIESALFTRYLIHCLDSALPRS